MEKKLKALAKAENEKLADAVLASAQQIWQAGLGAFAVAEAEGGKVFNKLVKEGVDIQKRTRRLAEIKVSGVTDSVTKIADNVGKQAYGSWDKIEQVFEDRVARTLATLGVPTSRDIRTLTQRIEELSHSVAALSIKKPAATKAATALAAKRTGAVKTAPKKVTKNTAAAIKTMAKTTAPKRGNARLVGAKAESGEEAN